MHLRDDQDTGSFTLYVLQYRCMRQMGKYRVTEQLVQNFPLTSGQKFRFGLACPVLARPKWNFCFELNGKFCTSCSVTLYMNGHEPYDEFVG